METQEKYADGDDSFDAVYNLSGYFFRIAIFTIPPLRRESGNVTGPKDREDGGYLCSLHVDFTMVLFPSDSRQVPSWISQVSIQLLEGDLTWSSGHWQLRGTYGTVTSASSNTLFRGSPTKKSEGRE